MKVKFKSSYTVHLELTREVDVPAMLDDEERAEFLDDYQTEIDGGDYTTINKLDDGWNNDSYEILEP